MLTFHLTGSGSIASGCGEQLLRAGHRLLSVVSDDAFLGRWAQNHTIPVVAPQGLRGVLTEQPCDYLLSIANWTVIDDEGLLLVNGMGINYHDSLLPAYAGSHSAAWSLLDGAHRHGISWHQMVGKVDGGPILLQRAVTADEAETTASLTQKYVQAATESFPQLLQMLEAGNPQGVEQNHQQRSFFRRSDKPIQATLLSPQVDGKSIQRYVGAHDFGPVPNPLGRVRLWTGHEYLYVRTCQLQPPGEEKSPGSLSLGGDRLVLHTPEADLWMELLDVYGRPLAQLPQAHRLPEPCVEWTGRLHRLTCELQPAEAFWKDRLSDLHELDGRALEEVTAPVHPADLALVLGYLARRCQVSQFDVGYRICDQQLDEFHPLFASDIPLRVALTPQESLLELSERLRRELEVVGKKRSFLNDLPSRYPGLKNRANGKWAVLIVPPSCEDTGRYLTLRLDERARPEGLAALGQEFVLFAEAARQHPDRPLVELPPDSLARELSAPGRQRVAPRDAWEEQIARVWSALLQAPEIGVEDNFFAWGGASILTAQLCGLLTQTLKVEVSPGDLVSAPTVAELAEILRHRPARENGLPSLQPRPGSGPFPLVDIQQAYWVGRGPELVLGGVSCHVYHVYEMFDLDLDRLNRAWNQLVQRHAMLRAVVHSDGTQEILEQVPEYRISCLDLRGQDLEEAMQPLRQRLSHQVLDCQRWPLFEIQASRTSDTAYRVHVSFDALTIDSWSRDLLLSEWRRLYDQPELTLEPLQITFRDYVLTLPEVFRSAAYQRDRDYWWGHLDDLPDGPLLPLACDPACLRPPRFERQSFAFDERQWKAFQGQCNRHGQSPNVVILAAFGETLKRWSKNQELTVNVTTFNRLPLHPQVNQVIGDFGSLLPIPIQNRYEATFLGKVQKLAQALAQEQDHGMISGVEILRELSSRKSSSPSLLFPVVFTCLTRPPGSRPLGRLVEAISQTPQIWFDHWVYDDQGGGKEFVFDVVEGLFPEGLTTAMMETYRQWLGSLAEDGEVWTLPGSQVLCLPAAQSAMRQRVNATECPLEEVRLQDLFDRQVELRPNQIAVRAGECSLTYRELQSRARRWATRLLEQPSTLVAVVMEKGWEQVVAVLAVHYAGAAFLPLDPDLPPARLEYLLDHGQVNTILTQSWLDESLTWPDSLRRLRLDESVEASETCLRTTRATDLAYVIYTSGSTGLPKGVMIDHRGAVNTIVDVNRRFQVGPEDVVLGLSSLSFDLSVYDLFGTLAAGARLVCPGQERRRDPAHWLELVVAEGVTVWNSVPALMGLFLEYLKNRVKAELPLRVVLLSGDWIPLTMPEQLKSHCPQAQMISLGGATEGSIWSVFYPIESVDPNWKSIPYGRPLANQSFSVLNQDLQDCPDWVVGDLYIQGTGVALGYWRDPERTEASFVQHPGSGARLYRTGDLGRYLPDGNLEILGREDTQVKVRGYRVELGEIEATLRSCPGVSQAVVLATGQGLQAYVCCTEQPAQDLVEYLRERLPVYMVPAAVVCLEQFPLSPNGKVDRKALAARNHSVPMAESQGTTPSQGLNRVVSMVRQLLATERVEANSNLLHLGATSIDMIRLLNHLELEFGHRPGLDPIYANPTPAAIYGLCQGPEKSRSEVAPGHAAMILDPAEQARFKASQPGLRRDLDGLSEVGLPSRPGPSDFAHRKSQRRFGLRPLELSALGGWLGQLAQVLDEGQRRYRYGSAGGTYPVQVYLWIKPGRVAHLDGAYYYHPERHSLQAISGGARAVTREAYDRLINRAIFEEAAFAVFLVAQLGAIEPIYGPRGRHFATLEAGLMTQVMEESALAHGLGLCQVGYGDFDGLAEWFQLQPDHWLVHSLLGGALEQASDPAQDEEQRLLERIKNLTPDEVAALLEADSL